jgi:Rps23 Pro-64 3,4-dihydroxylase Tpa1-like proline 4-hydroxylase
MILEADNLDLLVHNRAPEYANATPFPHLVIDDFLPKDLLLHLIERFPGPDSDAWQKYNSRREVKMALEDESRMPTVHIETLRELNSQLFVTFLEKLTGIEGLIPDPHFRGGGLHQIGSGGMLKIHADFNMHPKLRLERRLNVLLYLNDPWPDSYGGSLELWDKDMTGAVKVIAPLANRLVVFSTTDTSYHGHPEPLACPRDVNRRSMAWYYYSAVRPGEVRKPHTTLFQQRPGERLSSRTDTLRSKAGSLGLSFSKRRKKRLGGR